MPVSLLILHRPPAGHENRAIGMFHPPSAFGQQIEKYVLLVGQTAPQPGLFAYHPREIANRSRPIPKSVLSDVHQRMPLAVDHELINRRIARDNRRIDQSLIVRSAIVM